MRRTALAFLDMLLLILLLRHEVAPDEASMAKPVADYLLEIQWSPERADDIDVYVRLPNGSICYFRQKDRVGIVVLERDDLGRIQDLSPFNREQVAFRSLPAGTYAISIHNYRADPENQSTVGEEVAFEMSDRNGVVKSGGYIPMPEHRKEIGIATFEINDDGHIIKWEESSSPIAAGVLR